MITLIIARRMKRILSQSFCTHVIIVHHNIANPIQLTTPTAPIDPPHKPPTYMVSPLTIISFEFVIFMRKKYILSSFRYITEMAGADEILFLPEKAMVLDELIQVVKYCNMRKTKLAQPDHDIECIKPSQLYDFYFAIMDHIIWLKPRNTIYRHCHYRRPYHVGEIKSCFFLSAYVILFDGYYHVI